jgi:predicted MFS family arabinose efflux permease
LTAISGTFGWRTAFVVAGFGGLVVVWLIGTRLPGVERWPSRSTRGNSMMRAYRVLLGHRPTARLLTAVALRAVGWSGLLTYVGSVVTDAPGLGDGLVGPIYALGAGGYILGSLLAGRLLERFSPGVAAPVSAAVQAILIGCSASAVLGPVGTMAIQPLMGFAAAIGMVGMSLLLMTGSPAGTGSTMALNVALGNLGMALGGALGGVLLAWGGRNGLGVGLAVCVLAAAGMARNGTNRAARPGSSTVSAT